METKQVPFINRVEELEKISQALHEWDSTYAVFVQGEGGVGKTRFVHEAINRLKNEIGGTARVQHQEQSISVGVLLLTGKTGWGQLFLQGCRNMSDELGIQLIENDAENNQSEIAARFQEILNEKPDAIIIDLGSGSELQQAVDKAIADGVHVLMVSSDLAGDQIIEVAQDELHLALLSLQPMIEDLDGEGKIAICWNAGPPPLEARRRMLDAMLKRYPKIQVVAEIGPRSGGTGIPDEADPEADMPGQIVEVIREHPNLKAIWASVGEYGLGAVKALEITGRYDINIYSIDFDERIERKMRESNSPWKLTVASNPAEIGKIAVRVAVRAVYGEEMRRKYFSPINVISHELVQTINRTPGGSIPGWTDGSGVGWSPWLREIAAKRGSRQEGGLRPELLRSDESGQSWLFLNILDLDDVRLRSPQDLAIALVNQLGAEHFRAYTDALRTLRTVEIKNPAQYEDYRKVVDELFLQTLAGLSVGHRTVILCDTTDALKREQRDTIVNYLLRITNYLRNSVMLIAGRNAKEIKESFEKIHSLVQIELIELKPFTETVSREYLGTKQKSLAVQLGLEDEEIEKIVLLSRGLPIQIDLAVDWLARGMSRAWLTQEPLENLKALNEQELEERRAEFEKQLVLHIQGLRQQLDRLVLALAWVKPMGPELCSYLMNIPLEQATQLVSNASQLSFIKVLPDGQIKLHDYVQEMIRKHVWPEIEPERRTYTSAQAAAHYVEQMNRAKERIAALSETDVEKDALLREYWQTGAELVFHAFYADPGKGVDTFSRLFDEATRDYRIRLRETLVDVASANLDSLSDIEKYPIVRRKVRHLVDTGFYKEARDFAQEYLAGSASLRVESPGYYVDILTQIANCNRILGRLQQSRIQFQQVYELCKKDKDLSPLIPRMETNIGQVLRLMGDLDGAALYYSWAQEKTDDPALISSILNNLGYVVMLQGNFNRAINYCKEGLAIREEQELKREIGISHLTLGEIYRNWARYDDALKQYGLALAIFEREQDVYWLSQVNVHLGSTYRLLADFEKASMYLARSLSYKVPIQQPYVYHVSACVFWDKGEKKQALKQLELSDQTAKSLDLGQVFANNLLVASEILYEIWAESNYADTGALNSIKEKAIRFFETVPTGFSHHRARMWRVEADVAFEEGDFDRAKDLYANAYKFLGLRKGGYGKRTFEDELQNLEFRMVERLGSIDKDLALNWCHELRETWKNLPKETYPWSSDLIDLCGRCERKLRIAYSRQN